MRRDRVTRLVESAWFSNAVLGIIIVNAVILGWATYGDSALPYLLVAERVFIGVFVIEMTLKLYAWRGRFFRDPWNWFDFLVVLISLIPATGPFAVLRILRVLRVFRVITAVPQMRLIITALFKSVPGMGTVIGLLLVAVYASAIIAQQLFGEDVPEFFGDLGASLYTMFLLLTTENWPDVSEAVLEDHPMGWVFFVTYIVLTAFIMLNLVIGVIVTTMEREFNAERWVEDQALEAVQHEAVMARLEQLGAQVERLDRMLREQRGDGGTGPLSTDTDPGSGSGPEAGSEAGPVGGAPIEAGSEAVGNGHRPQG
ncbi:ion transporter [Nocardiopsis lambiniae]|uniref:Ion transporter n=1 Tax=Nocardiopsis lambiniae TaxID=3075539 RepID=A0ABU2M6N5_9ACTN|nr:ion transporter [Nocardiopsis sp. DSM 44743]MDT0327881.1 ion transporter [Nocardiopsis sp. DSM 44743]